MQQNYCMEKFTQFSFRCSRIAKDKKKGIFVLPMANYIKLVEEVDDQFRKSFFISEPQMTTKKFPGYHWMRSVACIYQRHFQSSESTSTVLSGWLYDRVSSNLLFLACELFIFILRVFSIRRDRWMDQIFSLSVSRIAVIVFRFFLIIFELDDTMGASKKFIFRNSNHAIVRRFWRQQKW